MDFGLDEKFALVCAASKGLGRACALALAKEGCRVAICARQEEPLQRAADEIRDASDRDVLAVRCDLSRQDDLERFVEAVLDRFGTVHILVTNVGHPRMGKFLEMDESDWQRGFEGLLQPVLRLCRRVVPVMQRQRWGRIVHITSVAVKEPGSPYLLSSVFRAGVAALSKSLANEFGRDRILVNTVCPGPFKTPLGEELLRQAAAQSGKRIDEAEAETAAPTALGRMGEADELAAVVAFLCSEQASNVTGQTLVVDGGMVRSLY